MLRVKANLIPRPYKPPRRNGKQMFSPNTAEIERIRCCFGEVEPVLGPVAVHFQFGMPIPKYLYKRIAKHGLPHCDKKPDVSNLIKLAEDAAKGYLFEDDAKVVVITAIKHYAEEPYTLIEVRGIDESIPKYPSLDPQYNPC